MSNHSEKINLGDSSDAKVTRGAGHVESLKLSGFYTAVCRDKDGNIKWTDRIQNLVTTVGGNLALDTILGNAAAGAVVMGLCGSGTKALGDTQASHAGWTERGLANAPAYTGNRPTPAFSAAAAKSKATSAAVTFAFTSGGTVAGCFINIGGSSTKDNTTGTLYSAGDFTGGDKIVANGDSLAITYTATG
jgi:hypothetical protein